MNTIAKEIQTTEEFEQLKVLVDAGSVGGVDDLGALRGIGRGAHRLDVAERRSGLRHLHPQFRRNIRVAHDGQKELERQNVGQG